MKAILLRRWTPAHRAAKNRRRIQPAGRRHRVGPRHADPASLRPRTGVIAFMIAIDGSPEVTTPGTSPGRNGSRSEIGQQIAVGRLQTG